MSGFWSTSKGEDLHNTNGEFESGGGDFEPIPNGTQCLAAIDEAKWDHTRTGEEFISLRWSVLQPEEYSNRKVFQKLFVSDDDPRAKDPEAKRDKALLMLAAIDKNAGGKLLASGEKPDGTRLSSCLTRKPMVIKIAVWKMKADDGTENSGNWISAVAPRERGAPQAMTKPQAKAPARRPAADEEVPF